MKRWLLSWLFAILWTAAWSTLFLASALGGERNTIVLFGMMASASLCALLVKPTRGIMHTAIYCVTWIVVLVSYDIWAHFTFSGRSDKLELAFVFGILTVFTFVGNPHTRRAVGIAYRSS